VNGTSARRWRGGVALGAYRNLRSGPLGVTELGRAFLEVHEGDFLAALGQLLLRVDRLERRLLECCHQVDSGEEPS
jgi:hypothetical protein